MGVVAGGVAVGGTSTVHAETLDENTENTVQAPEETEAPADRKPKKKPRISWIRRRKRKTKQNRIPIRPKQIMMPLKRTKIKSRQRPIRRRKISTRLKKMHRMLSIRRRKMHRMLLTRLKQMQIKPLRTRKSRAGRKGCTGRFRRAGKGRAGCTAESRPDHDR